MLYNLESNLETLNSILLEIKWSDLDLLCTILMVSHLLNLS